METIKRRLWNYIQLVIYSISLLSFGTTFSQDFYYAGSKKIILHKVSDKLVILHTPTQSAVSVQHTLQTAGMDILDAKVVQSNQYASIIQLMGTTTLSAAQTKLASQTSVEKTCAVVRLEDGQEMGLTDQIVLKFKNTVSIGQQVRLEKQNNLELVSKHAFGTIYRTRNSQNVIRIANAVFESGLVDYAHPNFLIQVQQTAEIPNDPLFRFQYNLHNVGQVFNDGHRGTPDADVDAPEAWDITRGNPGVVVAVIDEGVTDNHPDLPAARQVRLPGSNFAAPFDRTQPNDPAPAGNGNHGNACAGIIAATQGNREGVTGIAPNCRIMPIRIPFTSGVPATVYADAITFADNNGAAIISNSWGYNSTAVIPAIETAIQVAVNHNRVVVFAAGNTANVVDNNQGSINFPGNVNINTVLTVGASDRFDRRANYSPNTNRASTANQVIDLVAPSHRAYSSQIATESFEIWSIDIPGAAGYNPWNTAGQTLPVVGETLPAAAEVNFQSYTGRMGGTSAATPLVAGIAALVLSVNPGLTNQQVFDLLTCSADDVGGYVYTNGFSNEMGNGRVNAFNALMSLCIPSVNITWPVVGSNGIRYQAGQSLTLNNEVGMNQGAVNLQAGSSVQLTPGAHLKPGSEVRLHVQSCQGCVQNSAMRTLAIHTLEKQEENQSEVQKRLIVYPNPIQSGWLHFSSQVVTYRLINFQGQQVRQGTKAEKMQITGLPKGLYMLQLDNEVHKIVVE